MTDSHSAVYTFRFPVPDNVIDGNGHVNNVAYVKWMQDAAIRHFEHLGGTPLMQAAGATWVVHSHKIEYLAAGFAGEELEVRTWIANVRRVRSLRRYEFVRAQTGELLVRGETEWVLLDAQSGRPMAIPDAIHRIFPIVASPRQE